MKVVYVAGRFRGKTAWHVAENVRAAEQVGYHVAAAGAMPLIPHANTAHFDGTMTAEFWLEGTMELLRRCDAVMMVPGWLDSKGALAERAEAQRIGLPVFNAGDYDALRGWLASVTAGEAKPAGAVCTCGEHPHLPWCGEPKAKRRAKPTGAGQCRECGQVSVINPCPSCSR